MDVSIKIPKKGMLLINNLKNDFLRKDITVNNKELLFRAVEFSANRKVDFMREYIKSGKLEHDNTKQMTTKFLIGEKIKLGKNWLKEIDSTL